MENIMFVVIMAVCSILFLYLGFLLWKKEKISIMHDYHYTKVREEDKKAYTGVMGTMIRFYRDALGFDIKESENTSNAYLVKDGSLFLLYGRKDFENRVKSLGA